MTILTHPNLSNLPIQQLQQQLEAAGFIYLQSELSRSIHGHSILHLCLQYDSEPPSCWVSPTPVLPGSLTAHLIACRSDPNKLVINEPIHLPDGSQWVITEIKYSPVPTKPHWYELNMTLRELAMANLMRNFDPTAIQVKVDGKDLGTIKNFTIEAEEPVEDPWSGIYRSYQTSTGGACVETATGKQLDELAAMWGLTRGASTIQQLGSAKGIQQPETDSQLRSRILRTHETMKQARERVNQLSPSYDPGSTIQPEEWPDPKLSPLQEAISKRKADTFWGVPQEYRITTPINVSVDLKINTDGSIPFEDAALHIKRELLEHMQTTRTFPSPQNVVTGLKMLIDPKSKASLIHHAEVTSPNNGQILVTMQLHEQAITSNVTMGTIRKIVVSYLSRVLPVTSTYEIKFLSKNEAAQLGWH